MSVFGGEGQSQGQFQQSLNKVFIFYGVGFAAFVIVLGVLEQMGMPKEYIGYAFLAATVLLYGGIGVMSRTNDAAEYYVAGRRVPAIYNGMATGSDWMSAASFIGMAGTLYLTGYGGLAFILGWTGGYCLVALFLAPYLRKFGQFTIPDFLGARYGGNMARLIGVFAAILVSFVYVVAQIFGVGLITVRQAVQLLTSESLLAPKQGQGTFVLSKPETHPRMQVVTSLRRLAELYREQAPRLIPINEGFATPQLEPEDGISAPKYRFLRRVHASERQFTSVISAYIDERVFSLAPKRFRKETVIPVLMDLKAVKIGSARQILTIATAGEDAANALNIAVSAPVAEVRRVICSPDGTVIYLGELTYRGDYIRMDMDLLS